MMTVKNVGANKASTMYHIFEIVDSAFVSP